jgi:hypothetical protein
VRPIRNPAPGRRDVGVALTDLAVVAPLPGSRRREALRRCDADGAPGRQIPESRHVDRIGSFLAVPILRMYEAQRRIRYRGSPLLLDPRHIFRFSEAFFRDISLGDRGGGNPAVD